MNEIWEELEKKLNTRLKAGNLRQLRDITTSAVDFTSNDYLGLARSSKFKEAVWKEWKTEKSVLNGIGSTGSRLLKGNSSYCEELEMRIARYHGNEAGLIYNCGYMANIGLLSAIATTEDQIFYDVDLHASTYDGIRLSKASAYPFRHNDLSHLENRLKNHVGAGKRFVCIESIYSMDGSIAPLEEISALCSRFQANLIVDEAHAIGVMGPLGKGLVAEKNLSQSIFAQIITFGKGLGAQGSIVMGNTLLKEFLINFSRSFIYTTALPFHSLAAISCAYKLLPHLEVERADLRKLIDCFRSNYETSSETAIQPIIIKGNKNVQIISHKLAENGFDVRAITSPTVKRGEERLRISLHSYNTEKQIMQLIKLLREKTR